MPDEFTISHLMKHLMNICFVCSLILPIFAAILNSVVELIRNTRTVSNFSQRREKEKDDTCANKVAHQKII